MALMHEEGLHQASKGDRNWLSKGGRRGTPDKVEDLREDMKECGVLWGYEVTNLIGLRDVQV